MEKQYLKNRLSDITKTKDFQSLKASDKLLFFHLFPLLRVAESVVTVRGQEFKVPEGCYITSQRKLETALNPTVYRRTKKAPKAYMSQMKIRTAQKRLQKHGILHFEPLVKFNKNYGVIVMKGKNNAPNLSPFEFRKFLDSIKNNAPNEKINAPNNKKLTHQNEGKIISFQSENIDSKKSEPIEINAPKKKKVTQQVNKNVLIQTTPNARAFGLLAEETDLKYEYKTKNRFLKWDYNEFVQAWTDLFSFYQEHFPLKAGKRGLTFNGSEHTPEKLLLIRGWVEQRDADGCLKTNVWAKWDCFFLKEGSINPHHQPQNGNNASKIRAGYEFYRKIYIEQEKKMQKEQENTNKKEAEKKDRDRQNEIQLERQELQEMKKTWQRYSVEYPLEAAIVRQEAAITYDGDTKYLIPATMQKNGYLEVHFIYIKEKLKNHEHFQSFKKMVKSADRGGESGCREEKQAAVQ